MKTVLVIDGANCVNWYEVFAGRTFDTAVGEPQRVRIEQCSWSDFTIVDSGEAGCKVDIMPQANPLFGTNQKESRSGVVVDFVLVRILRWGMR